MTFSFIDIPRFVAPGEYEQAIKRMLIRLGEIPGIASVYQVGGVSTPGISDIDLLVVFEDGVKVDKDPRGNLSPLDKYLFTHHLFGIPEKFVSDLEWSTCLGNYRHLYGKELPIQMAQVNQPDQALIRKQVALEYLLKAFIASTIEHCNHIIKTRNFFLHAKALLIDLSFLGIQSGKLSDAVNEVMLERNHWFEQKFDKNRLTGLVERYHSALKETLSQLLSTEKFYLPSDANLKISRNVFLEVSDVFGPAFEGLFLPGTLNRINPKVPKLANRFHRFIFHVPVQQHPVPEVIGKRFNYMKEMISYGKQHFPAFMPAGVGLNIFNA